MLVQDSFVKAVFPPRTSEVSGLLLQFSTCSAVFLLRSNEVSWFRRQSSFVKSVKCSMPVRSPMDLLERAIYSTAASSAGVKQSSLSLSKVAT